jgi:hypothetical protein
MATTHSGVGKAKVADTLVAICTPNRSAASPPAADAQSPVTRGDGRRRAARRSKVPGEEPSG